MEKIRLGINEIYFLSVAWCYFATGSYMPPTTATLKYSTVLFNQFYITMGQKSFLMAFFIITWCYLGIVGFQLHEDFSKRNNILYRWFYLPVMGLSNVFEKFVNYVGGVK